MHLSFFVFFRCLFCFFALRNSSSMLSTVLLLAAVVSRCAPAWHFEGRVDMFLFLCLSDCFLLFFFCSNVRGSISSLCCSLLFLLLLLLRRHQRIPLVALTHRDIIRTNSESWEKKWHNRKQGSTLKWLQSAFLPLGGTKSHTLGL